MCVGCWSIRNEVISKGRHEQEKIMNIESPQTSDHSYRGHPYLSLKKNKAKIESLAYTLHKLESQFSKLNVIIQYHS